jgi:DNA-directed RNA polymerase subunit H (RpoH/RPB5)
MNTTASMIRDLRQHETLCRELLAVVERESVAFRDADPKASLDLFRMKKDLLPRLGQSVEALRSHRLEWQRRAAPERAQHPEVAALLRQNQEVVMKIIVLDRENEQTLLRQGLVPARQLPSVNRQRPNFVAHLYRRHGA